MKPHALILGSAVLLLSGTLVSAEQQPHMQYDSLGSPTPRPNQEASPTQAEPNVPVPAGKDAQATQATPQPSTTGAGPRDESPGKTPNPTGSLPNDGKTPSGLTPD